MIALFLWGFFLKSFECSEKNNTYRIGICLNKEEKDFIFIFS